MSVVASVDMICQKMTDTATAIDMKLAKRQRKRLEEKLAQMNKANNSRFLTQEDQRTQIQRLDNLANRRVKPNLLDTNLFKGQSLLTVKVHGNLV